MFIRLLTFACMLFPTVLMAQTITISPAVPRITIVTVATLPACAAATAGLVYAVSDASVPAIGGTVAGGGAVPTMVYCNGTNWIVD